MLVDALVSRTAAEIPIPDTGSVESDLETFTTDLAQFTDPRRDGIDPQHRGLGHRSKLRPPAAILVTALIGCRGDHQTRITRGEVAADTDAQLVVLTLGGLVHLYVGHIGDPIPADLPSGWCT